MATKSTRVMANPSALKAARQEAELSQREVAESLGVHRITVSRWEHGYLNPTIKHLVLMANLYEVDSKELMDETTNLVYNYFELLLMKQVYLGMKELEDGKVPALGFTELMQLAEKLGIFEGQAILNEEETDAQRQMAREIR